ncbi:MAG: urea transporter, partial [Gammaproteobacteria bacterium]
ELLYLTGAFVASTIWQVAAGLFWKNTNPVGASFAMLLGTLIGLASYFLIGFYVAALISAAVSMLLVLLSTLLMPRPYDWSLLNTQQVSAGERS